MYNVCNKEMIAMILSKCAFFLVTLLSFPTSNHKKHLGHEVESTTEIIHSYLVRASTITIMLITSKTPFPWLPVTHLSISSRQSHLNDLLSLKTLGLVCWRHVWSL